MTRGRILTLAAILAALLLRWWAGPQLVPAIAGFFEKLQGWGPLLPIVFILVYALATVALVPGSLLTLAGGLLFGLWLGVLYCFTGASLGSAAAFLVSRYLARGALEERLAGHPSFARIDRAVGRDGLRIVLLLRLSPFFPFVWLNYALGLTRVRFRDYLLASFGMLPGTFLYVYFGMAAGSLAALAGSDDGKPVALGGPLYWVFLALGLGAAILVATLVGRIAGRALGEEAGLDDDEVESLEEPHG